MSKGKKKKNLISSVFKDFISQHQGTDKTQAQITATINTVKDIIGNIPIEDFDFEKMRYLSETLKNLPSNRNKGKFKNLNIKDILNSKQDYRKTSIATYNNNIARISTFLNFSVKRGYIDKNAAAGFKERDKKARDQRDVFTDKEISTIFGQNYIEYTRKGNKKDATYWVPLIGFFTGARLNEICQLHVTYIAHQN